MAFTLLWGQGQGSRSNVWRAAVDIRGSALPSAAKGNKSHYQSKVFVCVSLISGHMQIIANLKKVISKISHGTAFVHCLCQDTRYHVTSCHDVTTSHDVTTPNGVTLILTERAQRGRARQRFGGVMFLCSGIHQLLWGNGVFYHKAVH